MITSERTQDTIVAIMMILAVLSSFSLVNSATYYGGSEYLLYGMEVTLEEIRITHLDPTNVSIDPIMSLSFRFKAPSPPQGGIRLWDMYATVVLNNDSLSYASFGLYVPAEYRQVYPGYEHVFVLTSLIDDLPDKYTLYHAYGNNTWSFVIGFRWFYRMFTSPKAPSSPPMMRTFNWSRVVLE